MDITKFNLLKFYMSNRDDRTTLGKKKVKIKKLTPDKWQELFAAIGSLPQLFSSIANAPAEDKNTYILAAMGVGLDDLVAVTALLTDIDEEYLRKEAGVDEIINYVTLTAHYNNLSATIKNVQSLLAI